VQFIFVRLYLKFHCSSCPRSNSLEVPSAALELLLADRRTEGHPDISVNFFEDELEKNEI
jgi:hypothetical protein